MKEQPPIEIVFASGGPNVPTQAEVQRFYDDLLRDVRSQRWQHRFARRLRDLWRRWRKL